MATLEQAAKDRRPGGKEISDENVKTLEVALQKTTGQVEQQKSLPYTLEGQVKLERLTGGRYRAVYVSDDNLSPRALRGAHGEFAVGTRELSYGTEEQLAFAIRLALGDLLVGEGASSSDDGGPSEAPHHPPGGHGRRQVLVMDDPLVNTDPVRLDVAWQILLEAADRLQLIILTCHPVPEAVARRARLIRLEGE